MTDPIGGAITAAERVNLKIGLGPDAEALVNVPITITAEQMLALVNGLMKAYVQLRQRQASPLARAGIVVPRPT